MNYCHITVTTQNKTKSCFYLYPFLPVVIPETIRCRPDDIIPAVQDRVKYSFHPYFATIVYYFQVTIFFIQQNEWYKIITQRSRNNKTKQKQLMNNTILPSKSCLDVGLHNIRCSDFQFCIFTLQSTFG